MLGEINEAFGGFSEEERRKRPNVLPHATHRGGHDLYGGAAQPTTSHLSVASGSQGLSDASDHINPRPSVRLVELSVGQEVGSYVVTRRLNNGSFGVAYAARRRDASSSAGVVLKVSLDRDSMKVGANPCVHNQARHDA